MFSFHGFQFFISNFCLHYVFPSFARIVILRRTEQGFSENQDPSKEAKFASRSKGEGVARCMYLILQTCLSPLSKAKMHSDATDTYQLYGEST